MTKQENNPDITVLIPTYNRAEILRETLEAMSIVNRDGLSVEFVVIDNNSKDNTKEVVESFTDILPLRYLFEPRPGKHCALNCALDTVALGQIVVFTDDDISPSQGWLQAMIECTRRWPDHKIFGGGSKIVWPDGEAPGWATLPGCSTMGLGYGDHSPFERECPYPPGSARPPGPNYWMRREIFDSGRRYDESVGPHPTIERRGTEMSMLLKLKNEGYEIIYCPDAWIKHRVQDELKKPGKIRRKAWANGLQFPRTTGLYKPDLLGKHPYIWLLRRIVVLFFTVFKLIISQFHISKHKRLGYSIPAISDMAYNVESIKIGIKHTFHGADKS
jgi:glycosyltransferase involved in cell wall biosynthesis